MEVSGQLHAPAALPPGETAHPYELYTDRTIGLKSGFHFYATEL
jgi:hypothetical protein